MQGDETAPRFRVRDISLLRSSLPFWLTFAIFTLIEVPVSLIQGRSYAWPGFEGWFITLLATAVGSTLLNLVIKVVFESSFVITQGAVIHDSRLFHRQISREGLKVEVDGGLRGLITLRRGETKVTLPDLIDLNSAGLRRFIFLETLNRMGIVVEGPGFTEGKKGGLEHGVLYERLIGWILVFAGSVLVFEGMSNAAFLTAMGSGLLAIALILLNGSRRSRGLISGLDAETMPGMPTAGSELNHQETTRLIIETEPSLLWGSRIRLVLQGGYGRKSPLTHFRPFMTGRMLRLISEARAKQIPITIDSHQGLALPDFKASLPQPSPLTADGQNKIRPDFLKETQAESGEISA